jgi:hypothetical protein
MLNLRIYQVRSRKISTFLYVTGNIRGKTPLQGNVIVLFIVKLPRSTNSIHIFIYTYILQSVNLLNVIICDINPTVQEKLWVGIAQSVQRLATD